MPDTPPDAKLSRVEKLRQKQAQLAAEIKQIEAREAIQARKDDTRRKVITGALALEHMEKNPDDPLSKKLFSLLDEYTRPAERRLFADLGLKPEAPPAKPANDQPGLKPAFEATTNE